MKLMYRILAAFAALTALTLAVCRLIPEKDRHTPIIVVSDPKESATDGVDHLCYKPPKSPKFPHLLRMGLHDSLKCNGNLNQLLEGEGFEEVTFLSVRFGDPLPKNTILPLDDLLCFPNLEELQITGVNLDSPESLSALPRLKKLTLNNCGLDQIPPLANIEELTLSNNCILDTAPLSGMGRLKKLNLSGNEITSLEDMAELNALEELDMSNTSIRDLNPLAELKNLRILKISHCTKNAEAPYFDGLEKLTRLEELDLYGNPIATPENLAALTSLKRLNIGSCGITSLEWVSGLTNLTRLNVSCTEPDTRIQSFEPIVPLKDLQIMIIDRDDVGKLNEIIGRTNVKILHSDIFFGEPVSVEEALLNHSKEARG